MLSLKKYFTEGLIQFTILLSLIGVRVDVDSYLNPRLPHLREIILGPSSAYTQTQFHNLRNTLQGYDVHPKSVDLDSYFTTRRLLSQVRALDRLQVPIAEVDAWLVHREPESSVSSAQPNPVITIESVGGLQEVSNLESTVRDDGVPEQGYGEEGEDQGAVAPPSNDDLTKEDLDLIDILWRQDIDLGAGREIFDYSNRQKESDVEKLEHEKIDAGLRLEEDEVRSSRSAVDGETGETLPVQVSTLADQTSLSLEECLRLLEATFPFGENSEALDVNNRTEDSMYNSTSGDLLNMNFSLAPSTPIHQNVSLHQALLPSCTQDLSSLFSPVVEGTPSASNSALLQLAPDNSTQLNSTFGSTNFTGTFFEPQLNSTTNETSGPQLPDPLGGLLDEAMLAEISMMDLAIEEGFNPLQASQLQQEFDSDSGLSLDSSHSPPSPSSSESSSSTASSSSSSSTSFSEEGAVGYSSDSEIVDFEGSEGAVGYQPEYSKFCRMSYIDPSQFQYLPYLEQVGHNHTYNMAPEVVDSDESQMSPVMRLSSTEKQEDFLDKQMGRDEQRARAMKIPFTNEKIINLPVEEFNEMLSKYQLSEAQLSLIRDIRRRGKNKMAAQNCRKRKLDTILNLEHDVDDLRRDKSKLLREKVEFLRSIRQMKQKVQSLYQEVFDHLRNENGQPYSPHHYALQYASDGSVVLMPRTVADQQARRQERKQKDRRK
ncbi:endoplasmic reticulum membrane sensor NFE2L1 isoform X2 [Pleurodeles waltl]|uniref:endoplasmic reticulum membrane sensor NFE2L1 isoform X2 n=1 Tax=Pleurodeles waltl TaxID=8319 RepID=UPI0037094C4E